MARNEILALAGLATPMALRVAVTLSLPDRLTGDGAATADLAAELDVDPTALGLLLNHLATLGVVEPTPTGHRTTEFGAQLRTDAGNGVADLLDLNSAGGRGEVAFVDLLHTVRTGRAAYPVRHGRDFYADLAEHPDLRTSFDRQMAHRFRADLPRFVAGFDWSRFRTILDVGGGEGGLLAAILSAHPGTTGHLLDVVPTAERARRTFAAHGLTDRAEVTGGSFFDPLPPGADAYVLFDVLHNWDDEHAHRILARCAEAARPDGRVLVVEAVGGRLARSESDLVMLVVFGGRERTLDELRALAAPHGLSLDAVTDLTSYRCLLDFRLT